MSRSFRKVVSSAGMAASGRYPFAPHEGASRGVRRIELGASEPGIRHGTRNHSVTGEVVPAFCYR